MSRPTVAVTMGDPAGIGPEVVAAAVADPALSLRADLVVVGDRARLARAAAIMGVPVPGRIEHIDGAPDDLPFGELSAAAGEIAYRAVARAVELVTSGAAHAIATAPLNKAALHLAGHAYPGHTELLAHLFGVDEVSMMLVAPRLKVIHVTTHVGLAEALENLDSGLVARTILRGNDALTRAGGRSRIGVCAVNPHGGENGLFGRGEEAVIAAGVSDAVAAGVDVSGPWPADTLFHRAVSGEFDLVVAIYHDQGHIPIKLLGLESGVNITVGLPAIRTSVDHGTAFDIAGTGRADPSSMRFAIAQAIDLAGR